jgi:hypothetical protein
VLGGGNWIGGRGRLWFVTVPPEVPPQFVDYLFTSRRSNVAQQPKNEQHDENRSKSAATDIHVILRGYMRRYRTSDTWLIGADGGYLTYRDTSRMTGPHLAP